MNCINGVPKRSCSDISYKATRIKHSTTFLKVWVRAQPRFITTSIQEAPQSEAVKSNMLLSLGGPFPVIERPIMNCVVVLGLI